MKMKQFSWLVFGLTLAASPFVRAEEKSPKVEKKSETAQEVKKAEAPKAEAKKVDHDQLSVALGHFFVRNLTKSQSPLKVDKIIDGMKAEMKKKEAPMTQDEFQQAMVALQVEQFQALSDKNMKDAAAFLEKNGKEKEVITLDPKLQYKVVKAGEGTEALTEESKPLVRVEGKLLDGTVFSANKEGDAIPLYLKETVPGISKGMIGMKKGEKRTVFIHPDLAFGANSPLPPNSLIIFDVEVVEMNSPEAKAEEAQASDVKAEAAPVACKEEKPAAASAEVKKNEKPAAPAQNGIKKEEKAAPAPTDEKKIEKTSVTSQIEVRKAEKVSSPKAEEVKVESVSNAQADVKKDESAQANPQEVKKEEKTVISQTEVRKADDGLISQGEVKKEGKRKNCSKR